MHSNFSSRSTLNDRVVCSGGHALPAPLSVMHIKIDIGAVTALRQLIMRVCGDTMEFMRIAVCRGTCKINVCVCVNTHMTPIVMRAVLSDLPTAEFGRISSRAQVAA